ncbi:ABC transporter permease [Bowmanella sp. Y26]|uniref:ABC transporter permease n=1 Tax=Bowmanella yangjiangensis TaxID=2811230 RepID=UPI001BDC51BB|nr:ABC transporter permease [Bowmanella yangjiangensis]MBT1062456.1 ABC transporter permease [Bowmanella yangjiangensis]
MLASLDQKLLRDLWLVRGQALAIAVVMAFGVMLMVMMDGLINSLSETKRSYYERYRLAQVFAPVKRAPKHLLQQISHWPDVTAVEGRINGGALINLPDETIPIRAQAVSLPDYRAPRLNDVYLAEGRRLDPTHKNEILLLQGFANARGIKPGDHLTATLNGTRRSFHVVGLAQAPEFLYTPAPGEIVPDDKRFAVFWMSEDALAAALDMDGAFNEVLLTLPLGANSAHILHQLDQLLMSYGALGAYTLDDHLSNRFISEEIQQLANSNQVVPPVFMGVAAFLLYIVISRMVQSEREQIGLLKAFGYTGWEISLHYLKFVLLIAILGALLGCVLGVLGGRGLSGVYQLYYKFPFLLFRLDPATVISSLLVSIMVACTGAAWVVQRVFALTPAQAMRPPTPTDFSTSLRFGQGLLAKFDQPTRMVLRTLNRHPLKTLMSISGIALGMALSAGMLNVLSAFDRTLAFSFEQVDRSDLNVSFVEPLGPDSLYYLARLPGVLAVEGVRDVPAIFHFGRERYRGAVTALAPAAQLFRALDKHSQPIALPQQGIVLSKALAGQLKVQTGDTLLVDIRQGRRPKLPIQVAAIAETMTGAPAYMDLNALNRLMFEPGRVSGAHLRIDMHHAQDLYAKLKDMPAIASVNLKNQSRQAMEKMMDEGAGATRYVMMIIAAVITFGIVYNSARIAFAERARDLASLRVMGLTKSEAAFVLLGELGIITLLAIPLGCAFGYGLSALISAGFSNDLYQVPVTVVPTAYGNAAIAVLLAALGSGFLIKRDLDRLDLVGALKTRE